MKKNLITLVLLAVLCSCEKEDNSNLPDQYNKSLTENKQNRLQFVLDSVCNGLQIKGVSCAVYFPNEGLWEGTYGYSHNTTQINKKMIFTIGSNTKTYIATLILKLQENGLLDINDEVSQYLSNVPYLDENITIKQLLNHTSGLGDFSFNPNFIQAIKDDFYRVWQPEETYPYFESNIATPGTQYSYSDQNYILAGLVIESVTNKPLKKSMRELVLNQSRLNKTIYYPFENTNLIQPHSWSADYGTGALEDLNENYNYSTIAFCSADNAAGGMLSTAKENVIFWNELMSGKIINTSSLNLLQEFLPAPTNESLYGLGIQKTINAYNNRTILSHNGYVPGSVNDNCYDSISGVCISVLTNQDQILDLSPILSVLHKETLNF